MEDQQTRTEERNNIAENIESLFEAANDYGKTNLDLLKLKAVDKSAEIISSSASAFVIILIMIIFFSMISIAIALLIGELLGKTYYGFFVLAGFYLIIGLVFNAMKEKWFKAPLTDSIIRKLLK